MRNYFDHSLYSSNQEAADGLIDALKLFGLILHFALF